MHTHWYLSLAMTLLALITISSPAVADDLSVFSQGEFHVYLDRATLPGDVDAATQPAEARAAGELSAAIRDLNRCLTGMTGQELPRAASQGQLPLRYQLLDADDQLRRQDYRTIVDAAGITIAATSRRGLINGTYGLLDTWGCRWILPGEVGEVIPKHETLSLAHGTTATRIAMDPRMHFNFRGKAQDIRQWINRNRAAADHWLSGQHYWSYAIPPEKYFESHPEYYALIDGKRMPQQLCTTNPEVIDIMGQVAEQYLANNPTAVSFPMDPNDNIEFCQCENCVALDPPGRWQNQPMRTDRVIHFANQIAQRIKSKFPDRYVALYAYLTHTLPPKHVTPEDNVIVIITRANFCLLHMTPNDACNPGVDGAAFEHLIEQWADVASHVYSYEYDPIPWTGELPSPIFLERARSIKRQYERGVRGMQVDGAYPASASNFMNHYLAIRFVVNPALDPQAELAAACQAYFGPAGDAMNRYYLTLAKASDQKHPSREYVAFSLGGYEELFTPAMVSEAKSALDEAQTLASQTQPYAQRVDMIALAHDYMNAYLAGIWNAQAGDYDATIAAFDHVNVAIDNLIEKSYIADDAVVNAKIRTTGGRLKTIAKYFPKRLGFAQQWSILGPFDNDTGGAIHDVADWETQPRLDFDKPYQSPAGRSAKWELYTSDEGFVSLTHALKDVDRPWTMSYAYAATRVRVPKPTKVHFRMDSFNGFKVYLNGKQVFIRPSLSMDAPDKRLAVVTLPAGISTIVIKNSQTAQGPHVRWGFFFRITDTAGNLLPELDYLPQN